MNKRNIIIVGFLFLTSCMGDGMSSSQREWLNGIKPKPLTLKEKKFVKELKGLGYYNIEIEDPIIGVVSYGNSMFNISMYCPYEISDSNRDSIKQANFEIAKSLYSEIIEDSILYDINVIDVRFKLKKAFSSSSYVEYHKWYEKSELEEITNLKVIKKVDGTFERVKG